MSKLKDLTGKKFGRLTALYRLHNYQEDLTIDRIDVNGNYEPDNCRWVDQKTQQNNRRNTIYLTYNNKKLTISQWSELLSVPQGRLRNRYNRGWSIKAILFGRKK